MNKDNYEDIINLPHHESVTRKRMSKENRAAQFAPFAALTGYDDAIKETARLTDDRKELDEGLKNLINNKLQMIEKDLELKQNISFTYFEYDKKKSGGRYVTINGVVKKIDTFENVIKLENGETIDINEIIDIKGDNIDLLYEE